MKLVKKRKKGMDLTKETETTWAETMARAVPIDDIPIITRYIKGETMYQLTLRVFLRLHEMAEEIVSHSTRFKSFTDVHRASHYLGMMILYNLVKLSGQDTSRIDGLFKILLKHAKFTQEMLELDAVVDIAVKYKKGFEMGLLSAVQRDEKIDEILDMMSPEIHKAAEHKIYQVMSGGVVSSLYECKSPIGGREKKG